MKKAIIWSGIAAALVGGLIWLGSANQGTSTSQNLTFAVVQQDTTSGAKLYDVRTAEEYAAGHFEQAINWSLQDIEAGKLPDVPKDSKIFLYCRSGNRSSQAAVILKDAGYTNIVDLGGLPDVQSIGGTLVTEQGRGQ